MFKFCAYFVNINGIPNHSEAFTIFEISEDGLTNLLAFVVGLESMRKEEKERLH